MACTKDSVSPRFTSARPPPSPTSSALPIKAPQPPHHHRNHPFGSVNPHRVTRRKSMSSTSGAIMAAAAAAAAAAAVVAAVKEGVEVPFSLPVKSAGVGLARSPGRSNGKVVALGKSGTGGSFTVGGSNGYPSPPSSLPTQGPFGASEAAGSVGGVAQNLQFPRKTGSFENGGGDSAIAEGYGPEVKGLGRRRASEGAHVVLGGPEGSTSGRGSRARSGSELKCEKCGKGYKHSSCLTKHLWEHTPEWSYTSKLLISKHQQVQLLEAASILVSMNPSTTPPASLSGASIHESNSSINDGSSSSEDTTPPPHGFSGSDIGSSLPTPRGIRNGAGKPGKRLSSGSYSRSHQASGGNGLAGSAPCLAGFPSHFVHKSTRPRAGSSAGNLRSPAMRPTSIAAEDEALASAIELLSCSFRTAATPIIGPTMVAGSIPRGGIAGMCSPPVAAGSFLGPLNNVLEMKREEEDDVRMEDLEESRDEDEEDVDVEEEDESEIEERWTRRRGSDEEEDGVFGRMEE